MVAPVHFYLCAGARALGERHGEDVCGARLARGLAAGLSLHHKPLRVTKMAAPWSADVDFVR